MLKDKKSHEEKIISIYYSYFLGIHSWYSNIPRINILQIYYTIKVNENYICLLKYKPTAYRIGIQFSIVTHWNTVNIAKPMLSNEVIPLLGPSHFSRQTEKFESHMLTPQGASSGFPMKQGLSFIPSVTTSSK